MPDGVTARAHGATVVLPESARAGQERAAENRALAAEKREAIAAFRADFKAERERPAKVEKVEKVAKIDKVDRVEKIEKIERPEKIEKIEKIRRN